MTWLINELVRHGNSTGRVQSYNKDTRFIVLMDIQGSFPNGAFIVGEESGSSGFLNLFSVADEYSGVIYASTEWDDIDNMIHESGDGPCELIALDEHFTGLPSQDYQTTFIVRES